MMSLPSLRELRHMHGWTMLDLVARSGVSKATISRIERGTATPRPNAAHRLAAALGVAPRAIAELRSVVPVLPLAPPRARRLAPAVRREAGLDPPLGHHRLRRLVDEHEIAGAALMQQPGHEGVEGGVVTEGREAAEDLDGTVAEP